MFEIFVDDSLSSFCKQNKAWIVQCEQIIYLFWNMLFGFLVSAFLLLLYFVGIEDYCLIFVVHIWLCICILLKRVGAIRYSSNSLMFQCKFRGSVQCYNATNGHLRNSRDREQCFNATDGHLRNSRDREKCFNATDERLRNSRDREQCFNATDRYLHNFRDRELTLKSIQNVNKSF